MRLAKLLFLALILTAAPSFAASLYIVTVDATSLAPGTSGFIDLAFNGGYPATATIDNFTNVGGSLNAGSITTQGTVTGTLPGQLILGDDNADYDEGITFGPTIRFLLSFAGTPSGTVGNVFTLSFFNAAFTDVLLTGNENDGWLAQFQMDTAGNVTATAFNNPLGGPSFANLAAQPEPGTIVLMGIGLVAAAILTRRKAKPVQGGL